VASMRPQDLPELRADFRSQVASPQFMRYLLQVVGASAPFEDPELAADLQDLVDQADLYYVSASMTEVVCAAFASLETFTPERADFPSPTGLVMFDGSLPKPITFGDGCVVALRGMFWSMRRDRPEVVIFPIGDDHDADIAGPVAYSYMMRTVPFGEALTIKSADGRRLGHDDLLSLLETALLLMQQPMTASSVVQPDRAVRKRLQRQGQEAAAVRVIELRRPTSPEEPGDGTREYHHQWIVKGHWRQQWYPTRQVHRPVWIAPHVKGPEGAPMLGGEKVYAWKR
jgi:hypothetical protein